MAAMHRAAEQSLSGTDLKYGALSSHAYLVKINETNGWHQVGDKSGGELSW